MNNKLTTEEFLQMLNEAGMYTIDQLQTAGNSHVHWENLTNVPPEFGGENTFVHLDDTPATIIANYKLVGNALGTGLIFVEDTEDGVDGVDGREVELQNDGTNINWRLVDDPELEWQPLIALSELKGDKGDKGDTGLKGDNGTPAQNIELQKTSSEIQWKLEDETGWHLLVLLEDIKGDKGDTGDTGNNGVDGIDGNKLLLTDDIPTPIEGNIDDLAINTNNWELYKKTASDTWTSQGTIKGDKGDKGDTGNSGADGIDGHNITIVSTIPDNTFGNNNDSAINKNDGTLYEKIDDEWAIIGTLKGVPGNDGTDGADGADGDRYYTLINQTIDLSSITILEEIVLTVSSDLSYSTNQLLVISYNASNYFIGRVLTYDNIALTVSVQFIIGDISANTWEINLAGALPLDVDFSQYALLNGRDGDSQKIDDINEFTTDAGVTIENVILKDGYLELSETASPDNPDINKGKIYLDSSTHTVVFKNSDGTTYDLTIGVTSYNDLDDKPDLTKYSLNTKTFHNDIGEEISVITNKTVLSDNDVFLGEDSENSYSKIKVLFSSFKSSLKNYFDGLYPSKTNVLEKNNTTSFTPDADYEPATKKYVDDTVEIANSDVNAIHKNVDAEISTITQKTTIVDNDIFIAENSENSFSKIKLLFSTIKATLKEYFDTVYTSITLFTGLKSLTNYSTNPMLVSGGTISLGTNADTIKVGALKGYLRQSNSLTSALVEVNLTETDNIEIPVLGTMYDIVLDYNSGTPQITLSDAVLNENTEIPIGYVMKDSTGVFYREGGFRLQEASKRLHDKNTIVNSVKLQSGCKVSDGDRYVKITSGIAYSGINKYLLDEVDTSGTDTFINVYNDGDWQYVGAQTQVNNTQYNDFGTGLTTLSNNQYGIFWVWKNPTSQQTSLLMGTASYTLAEAQTVNEITSIPEKLNKLGVLIGKIIIQKNATDFIFQSLDNTLAFTGAYDHNDLLHKGTITHEEIDAKFKKGSDIASASTITIPADGEFCEVTGTTTIDLIETAGYIAGKTIALKFLDICTLNFETATSGTAVGMHLVKGSNYTTVAGDIIVLKFDGTIWQEVNNMTNSFWKGDGDDIVYNGKVGIKTKPAYNLDVVTSNFMIGSNNDNSDIRDTVHKKGSKILMPHYDMSKDPVILLMSVSYPSFNRVYYGGGSSGTNWATELYFYTSLSSTDITQGGIRMMINNKGNVAIGGNTTPTAKLHLPAGTASAGTAPLKIPEGVLLTVLEDGAIERQNNKLYITFDD